MEYPPLHSTFIFWTFNLLVAAAAVALTVYCARIRKGSGKYLCEDCRFNDTRSCLKKERPYALVCSSYRDILIPSTVQQQQQAVPSELPQLNAAADATATTFNITSKD